MSYDPTKDPVVPFFIRLRKDLNLTQAEFAREAQVTRIAVLRNEHICYPTPLPRVATTLSLLSDLPLKNITHEYHIDVMRRRRYTATYMLRPVDAKYYLGQSSKDRQSNLPDFKRWRIEIMRAVGLSPSIIKFSSLICVHPNVITVWEALISPRQAKRMTSSSDRSADKIGGIPQSLEISFREMGYPDSFLESFTAR